MTEEVNRLAELLREREVVGGSGTGTGTGTNAPESGTGTGTGTNADATGASTPMAELGTPGNVVPVPVPVPVPETELTLRLPQNGTLAAVLEAVLLVANEPMSVSDILKILDGATRAQVNAAVRELKERYASRPGGFDLCEIAGGVRLLTRPEYAPWVERLEKVRREERLSRAQLECLAVVAYRQPLLRADVDSVRGADSGAPIRGLVDKGLIKVVGRADALGRPLLYGTTDRFLERFGLKSLKDLPRPKAEA